MTLEEAIQAAAEMLEEREQLLNAHLLRLVQGDKELFRQVRERLILDGLAEDRSGVGLARSRRSKSISPHATSSADVDNLSALLSKVPEWWLMIAGVIRGPFDLLTIGEMRRRGEIKPGDVVRHGPNGLWGEPDDIPELANFKPEKRERPQSFRIRERFLSEPSRSSSKSPQEMPTEPVSATVGVVMATSRGGSNAMHEPIETTPDVEIESQTGVRAADGQSSAAVTNRYVPPEKIWALGHQRRPNFIAATWNLTADLVGGGKRLSTILVILLAVGLFVYWWRQPVPPRTIFNEFSACRAVIMKLQDRRAKRSEWSPVIDRYKPRVLLLLKSLEYRASTRYPLENSLYLAGTQGLLRLFESPMDPTAAERAFDQYMKTADRMLNGDRLEPSPAAPAK